MENTGLIFCDVKACIIPRQIEYPVSLYEIEKENHVKILNSHKLLLLFLLKEGFVWKPFKIRNACTGGGVEVVFSCVFCLLLLCGLYRLGL